MIHLCREGKIKEVLDLLEEGMRDGAMCFGLLLELCGKSKKLEDA